MESKKRRQFSSEQKAETIKRHVVGKEDISVICAELDLHSAHPSPDFVHS